ncbi:uncharacterized protein LOC129778755 [Toxorhynchites rutilus septentrionalis]|uniref:uncharacterized protein LOC129778755 n=1 Tax=Toxorhynchites rutilus septentrionalis TaxID=329112 RepID=UPI00247A038B|nr:uncharacterized protein LOC129778755 [Toxorhynchites rutilus septentrionalis]
MDCLTSFILGIVLMTVVLAAADPCANLKKIRTCNETQYETYRQCVEEVKLLRQKRQSVCPQIVVQSQLYRDRQDPREHDKSVKLNSDDIVMPSIHVIPALESVVPVEPIDSNDIPGYEPPDMALKTKKRKIIFQGDEGEKVEYQVPTNVTTVIRLTNVVNNTNIVNVPTHVNTTNVNNIHIYSNVTESETRSEQTKCCTAVRPKTCYASTQGFRCQHKKFQTCGPQCTSDIIHVQRRKRCDQYGNCKDKVAYVPQPEKPKCVYIDQWPYVACGKPANMKVICDGCYDHYGRGIQAHDRPVANQCRGCYDDGFDLGPMYRRGPVLRPFHYHEPPCYITGSCPATFDDCGYGCYGHEMVDPAWGQPSPYDPEFDDANTAFYDNDFQESNDTESDWGIPVHKCTVVSEDNKITVQNCTDSASNQYAAVPSNYPYYKPLHMVHRPGSQSSKYRVKQTMRRHSVAVEPDDNDPSSGEGSVIVNSDVSFIVEDDENEDYSL